MSRRPFPRFLRTRLPRAAAFLLLAPHLFLSSTCVTLEAPARYASEVVSFEPGDQANRDFANPAAALGAPDMNPETLSGFVNLGVGGTIVVGFGGTAAVDGPGADIVVYGDPADDEQWTVAASDDGTTWKSFGKVGEVARLDLATVSLASARFVRITDDAEGGTGVSPGGELDAVGIVHELGSVGSSDSAQSTGSAAPAAAKTTTAAKAAARSASPLASAAWVRLGGPIGGLGYDIRVQGDDPRIMYVTDAWAGVHKSTDAGATWTPSNTGIDVRTGASNDSIPAFCLTIDPNDPRIVWAGVQTQAMLYRSSDSGKTWQRRGAGIVERDGLSFRGITVQQGNSDVVYAAAEISSWVDGAPERRGRQFDRTKGVLYKSTDAGRHWTAVWRGDDLARYVWIDPRDPKVLYLSTGIFDREAANSDWDAKRPGGEGILKSTDGGASWKRINTGLGNLYVGSLFLHPTRPDTLLAGAGNNTYLEGSGVYLTTDGGAHWKLVQKAEQAITSVEFSQSDPRIAYAAGAYGFWASSDGGVTWVARERRPGRWGPAGVNAGFPIDFQVDPRDPRRIFANNYGGGNFLSVDGGRTWISSSTGYTGADIRGLAVKPGNPAVVYATGRSGPYRSTDGGAHWDGVNPDDPTAMVEGAQIAFVPPLAGRMIMTESNIDRVYWSDDEGSGWSTVVNDWGADARAFEQKNGWYNTGFEALAVSVTRPGRVYAAFGGNGCKALDAGCGSDMPPLGIARSDDGGKTWKHLATLPRNDRPATAIAVSPTDADAVVVAMPAAGVFRSADAGRTFTAAKGLGATGVLSLAWDSNDANVLYAGARAGGLYKSVDGGATWKPSMVGIDANEFVTAVAVDPAHPGVVYAGTLRSGLFISADAGRTWRPHNEGLRTRAILVLALSEDGSTLYAGTQGEGVFRLSTLAQAVFDRLGRK